MAVCVQKIASYGKFLPWRKFKFSHHLQVGWNLIPKCTACLKVKCINILCLFFVILLQQMYLPPFCLCSVKYTNWKWRVRHIFIFSEFKHQIQIPSVQSHPGLHFVLFCFVLRLHNYWYVNSYSVSNSINWENIK